MKRPLLALPFVLLVGAIASAQSFTYTDFSSVAGLNLVGLATQAGTILRLQDNLIPAVSGNNRGAAWYATAVCVSGGFDTTFTYRMHTPSTTGGSDGLCFVIQDDQAVGTLGGIGNTTIGQHASAIGYGIFVGGVAGASIDNSLAIELDTFLGTLQSDPDANHISIHTNGTGENNAEEIYSIGRAPTATVVTNLNDGANHTIRVVYVPGTIDVYLDGVLKLTAPYNFSTGATWLAGGAVGGLNLIGGTSAYVGFTSSAGSAREFRDVLSWSWTSTCPNTPTTSFCDGSAVGTTCLGCGNNGSAGNGCANFGFAGGGHLAATGIAGASVGTDTLVLTASDITGPGLFFQADGLAASPIMFGDGMLCAAVNITRMGVVFADGLGVASYPGGLTPNPIHIAGGALSGQTKHYQCWFRDSGETSPGVSFCTSATYNLTQGVSLTWGL